MRERFTSLLDSLNDGLYEREEQVKMVFLAAMSGESIFLLGPPGVAKSLIARRLKYAFKDATTFEYLMNRFSTPEEIFGPISISKLRDEDKLERVTESYLPSSNIAFLDEIWKAGPSIQNTLLTIINERIFRNGTQVQRVPLLTLIAASNELPAENQGLEALWDRFIIRMLVDNIEDKGRFSAMISDTDVEETVEMDEKLRVSFDEHRKFQSEIAKVVVPGEIFSVIDYIRLKIKEYNSVEINEKKIYVSDRRWKKIIKILRTSAFINGRKKVDLMDCFLIADMIWSVPEQQEQIRLMIRDAITENGYSSEVNLSSIEDEIEKLDIETKKETMILNKESYQTYITKKTKHNGKTIDVYQLSAFYNDYNKTQLNPQFKYVCFRDKNLNKVVQGSPLDFFDGNLKLIHTNSLNQKNGDDFRDQSNHTFTLAMTSKEKAYAILKKPHPILVTEWDRKADALIAQITKIEAELKQKEARDFQSLKENLFVDPSKAEHILVNLKNTYKRLSKEKILIDEVKHTYANIEDGKRVNLEDLMKFAGIKRSTDSGDVETPEALGNLFKKMDRLMKS